MRTQKRFTPTLIERFLRERRGTGTYQNYLPWHRVGRSDPSSIGRSHLMIWRKRQLELLSDGEWDGALFATMLALDFSLCLQYRLLMSGLVDWW